MRVVLFDKFVALAAVIAITGCAVGRASTVGGEAGVRRAALARIVVDNRTGEAIDVAFLTVADPGREVVVGGVAARSTALVAPVLAGEPIVLVARTASGAELRLAARSFEDGAEWTWVIPEDAWSSAAPRPSTEPSAEPVTGQVTEPSARSSPEGSTEGSATPAAREGAAAGAASEGGARDSSGGSR